MSQQSVLLQLPDELYERVRAVAAKSNRPLENVLLDGIALMFGDLTDLNALTPEMLGTFTDDQLWAFVWRRLTWSEETRLQEVRAQALGRDYSSSESDEIDRLLAQLDRYTLLRSHALLLLKQRGHDVERRLKLGA